MEGDLPEKIKSMVGDSKVLGLHRKAWPKQNLTRDGWLYAICLRFPSHSTSCFLRLFSPSLVYASPWLDVLAAPIWSHPIHFGSEKKQVDKIGRTVELFGHRESGKRGAGWLISAKWAQNASTS